MTDEPDHDWPPTPQGFARPHTERCSRCGWYRTERINGTTVFREPGPSGIVVIDDPGCHPSQERLTQMRKIVVVQIPDARGDIDEDDWSFTSTHLDPFERAADAAEQACGKISEELSQEEWGDLVFDVIDGEMTTRIEVVVDWYPIFTGCRPRPQEPLEKKADG